MCWRCFFIGNEAGKGERENGKWKGNNIVLWRVRPFAFRFALPFSIFHFPFPPSPP
jgi:hypothetical protein